MARKLTPIASVTEDDDPTKQAFEFLATLFEGIDLGYVVLSGQDGDGEWQDSFASANLAEANSLIRLAEQAVTLSHEQDYDIYVATSVMSAQKRVGTNVRMTPALWTEFDYAGSSEKKSYEPWTDRDEVEDFINTYVGLAPSIMVESGNGVHAWWRFDEPLEWWDEALASQSEGLLSRWEQWLHSRAAAVGRGLDTVVDLGRVLRVPGTLNHKRGHRLPVRGVHYSPVTYSPREIEEMIPEEHSGRALRAGTDTGFVTSTDLDEYIESYGAATTDEGSRHAAEARKAMSETAGGRHFALVAALAALIQPRWRNQINLRATLGQWSAEFDTIKPPAEQTPQEFTKAVRDIVRRRIAEDGQVAEARKQEVERSERIEASIPFDKAALTYEQIEQQRLLREVTRVASPEAETGWDTDDLIKAMSGDYKPPPRGILYPGRWRGPVLSGPDSRHRCGTRGWQDAHGVPRSDRVRWPCRDLRLRDGSRAGSGTPVVARSRSQHSEMGLRLRPPCHRGCDDCAAGVPRHHRRHGRWVRQP